MSPIVIRRIFISFFLAIAGFSSAFAQTISVNGTGCPNATVTYGAGTILINTAGCGTTAVAPVVAALSIPLTGTVNSPYPAQTFTTTSGTAPITWSISTPGTQPPGLNISSAGVLSGTPTTAGTYSFSVNASNGTAPNGVSATYVIVISAPSGAPVITSAVPPATGVVNLTYPGFTFTNSGAQGTTWTTATGALPNGLAITGAVLGGMPTTAGTYTFTVTANNGTPPAATSPTYTITISTPVAPVITALSIPLTGTVASAYPSQTFTLSSGTAPITWSITGGTQPAGLTLNPSTGVLSGTPTTAGSYTFAVQASNGTLPSAVTGNFTIVIAAAASGSSGPSPLAIDGSTIPYPVSKAAKTNGPSHAVPNGAGPTINAWSISPSRCTNTSPPITTLWHHNIDFADYARKVTNDYPAFGPNEAMEYQFTADPTNLGMGLLFLTQGPYGVPSPTFVSISTKPCDFDLTKVAAGDACYGTATSDNGFYYEITNAATAYGCKLVPGTTYYLNLRWQDARPGPGATQDACAGIGATLCGTNMGIKKL